MPRIQSTAPLLAGLAVAATLFASPAQALVAPKEGAQSLAARSLTSDRLSAQADNETLGSLRSVVSPAIQNRWDSFALNAGGQWQAEFDKRSGQVTFAEGSGLPWIAGRGNNLDASVIARFSRSGQVDLAAMEAVAREFLPQVADMLGVSPAELVLNQGRSGQPAGHLWFVDFDVVRGGHPIDGARVVFRVNNGNLIQFGSENLPARDAKVPAHKITRAEALATLGDYIGGFHATDTMVDRGSLRLLPVNRDGAATAEGYEFGKGRGLELLWQFSFRRVGEVGTFRGRVNATTGELVDFYDVNEYGAATGGAYRSDRPAAEVVLPLPFANVAAGVYTNSAGIFSGTTGTTTLDGQYVKITDSCGAISKAADASGVLALGSSAGTDCTTPGSGGAGNTHAARTQFYDVNRAKEVGRGWLPTNTWLQGKLTANVNLNQTCNAYWNGSTLNFFKSGGGCANTGELPGISLHEFGHGLDSNDGSGSSVDNGTGETYGDFTAALATHSSCVGNGFLASNCGGYGNPCTSCTGVRDIDWAKHSRNVASTVANFTQTTCPNPSPNNPNYKGPCGKEGHCESLVSSEALWDLANRDLPSPGSGAAWATTDRLWYLSRSTATKAFNCTASGTWSSNGCFAGSYFRTMRAVDDDNGNLSDGTPHGAALAAAFNRHGLACTTDVAWNVTFAGVAPPAVPTLTVTGGSNTAALSWTGSSGVYDVYRNEAGCNAGFTKVANDLASASYNDAAVANGFTYYYQVVAQPSGNEAAASAPSACNSVTPVAAPCTPPAAPTGLVATVASASQINLSWTAASGATSYTISRATTSGGPYTSVGTSATTSFSDTGLSCNTTYYYVVSASNGTCGSANSTQASALTSACTGNVLTNGVAKTAISGAAASQQFWTMAVPAGATGLRFVTTGGTGDADLYVKFGSAPTTTVNDCRSEGATTAETCNIATAQAGTYHVLVYGYSAFSGMSLTGSYTPAGTELVTDGGFESASTLWVYSGGAARSTGAYPHSGVAYSFLGNTDNAANAEYQQISIPAGTAPSLSFWLNVTSAETTTTTQYDRLFVEVRNTAGTLLATLATYSNLNKATAGVYSQKTGLSLSAYAGQTVRLQFRATTDSSLITTFRVDDVSVK
jgi:trimeric autotransporter adhesin